jgi:hypothetical protein
MAPQDDLTAERVAIALLEQMGLYGHPAASQFVGDIIAALKAARQEALREAAKVAIEHRNEAIREDLSGGYTAQLIADELDRLASEGG